MIVYRQYATVPKSKQIVLSDVPFQPGQQVEVVALSEERRSINLVLGLRETRQVTQALPQSQAISEDEITAEITAYRASTIPHHSRPRLFASTETPQHNYPLCIVVQKLVMLSG